MIHQHLPRPPRWWRRMYPPSDWYHAQLKWAVETGVLTKRELKAELIRDISEKRREKEPA